MKPASSGFFAKSSSITTSSSSTLQYASKVSEMVDMEFVMIQTSDESKNGAEIVFALDDHERISVSVFPSSPSCGANQSSKQDHLISLSKSISCLNLGSDEESKIQKDMAKVISDAGPITLTVGERNTESNPARDLHSFIYPVIHHFKLLDDACGKAIMVPIEPDEAFYNDDDDIAYNNAEEDKLDIDTTLPWHSTKAIIPTKILLMGNKCVSARAVVNGKQLVCNASGHIDDFCRELEYLQHARKDPLPNVPQLVGYIRHADTNRIVGYLQEWIPGRLLDDIDVSQTPGQERQKWVRQICETVHALHGRGMTWCGGDSGKVVINEEGDACVIDFAGCWASGWEDEAMLGTVAGDEQALCKIAEFLRVEEC
ncbi:hypothetical protein CDD82_5335 [Ophiocordyceps australis]|uniref:Uncharacterized protein n=1 Tax=Ophiocordyceps australis TaxID=1399860 RepID=A0A2C5YY20_9HYPO|nr:hypothetical protein CDD82_5335 [Ophiocordyceps australis]